MELKMVKFDLLFISPFELQIIFSFDFFVLKVFVYEISKRAIIHMDFIKHFSKYCDLKKIASIKTTNVIIILFKFKNRIYECSQMYEHQLINDYNHKL
jgi:hypothetical protein